MIRSLKQWFYSASIFKKQLLSFGFILLVFFANLVVLYGSVSILSDVRAYVNGESLWAKAQKDAVYSLRKYIISNNPQDYQNYLDFLKVPLGDEIARLEMEKSDSNYEVVYQGFLAGRNDPKDIPGMIFLFENFRGISYLREARDIWAKGDEALSVLIELGSEARSKIIAGGISQVDRLSYLTKIESINYELTLLEDQFSFVLGDASRFIVNLVLISSFLVSLILGLMALVFVSLVSNFISHRIGMMKDFALQVSKGDLTSRLKVDSEDEIGFLATSLNIMTENIAKIKTQLDTRNSELETRVKEIEENNQYLEKVKAAALNLLEDLDATKASLQEEKLKDEAILSSIGDGMLAVDQNGILVLVNHRAEDMLGFNPGELIGRPWDKAIILQYENGETVPLNDRPVKQAMVARKRVSVLPLVAPSTTLYMVRKNGTKFPVEIVASPIILKDNVLGAVEIFRDITREKEIEKVKTEFVSIASHQLRTPLSTINWYSEILLAEDAGKLNEAQKEYMQEIYRGNQRMIDLVNALLNVSRLEVGAFIVEAKAMNLVDVVKDVLNEVKPQVAAKNIEVIEQYAPNLSVIADYSLARIIFQNLISNAVKYTNPGGKIGVTIDHQDGLIEMKVWDTGLGIPKRQQDKIFTKLFRADNAREADPDGTGLGLYIVKSIIDQTDGKIWFESEEGKGTTFHIVVPANWMHSKTGTRRLI